MAAQQLQLIHSSQNQVPKNKTFEEGRRKYESDIRELFNDQSRVVTNEEYRQVISQPLIKRINTRSNHQEKSLGKLEETSEQTEEKIELIMRSIFELSNQINELNEKQDEIMNRQISIHNDVKSYGNKTVKGIRDIKKQGGDIFNKCFPPKGEQMVILCFNQILMLILKLLQFIFSLYYNTSYLCINIGKTTLGKIPLFGLLLAPLFELCATLVFVWLTMTIVTKSSSGMINGKQILIASIQFLRYMLKYVSHVVSNNINTLFTDIKDVFNDSGLNEDAEIVQSYLSSIKVVQYADATLSSINDAAANLQYTKETASYVYESLPNIGLEYGLSSLFSKASDAMTGGNTQENIIDREVIEELTTSNMKTLFGQTGGLITNIVNIITKSVKLYNDLSPEAKIMMNKYLQKNRTKTLEYRLNKDIRKLPLYKAFKSIYPLHLNKGRLLNAKKKSMTRKKQNSNVKSKFKSKTSKSILRSKSKSLTRKSKK